MAEMGFVPIFLLTVLSAATAHPCESCHAKEVAAYSRSSMAHALRRAGTEPDGTFTAGAGTRFTIRGLSQRLERSGQTWEYRAAYVIGSGRHASGFLIEIGNHLFQSPICYYTSRRAYDLAPGYERIEEPDFTRPVNEECVLCHSGRPRNISGTVNQYGSPPFVEEAISCERCHGPPEQHLRNPVRGSIVNPAKLAGAARDSICEQCHLSGVTRVLNPGKAFADFRPGQRLEEVFTVYVRAENRDFRVISHVEQLAMSACARKSGGKLWCGTCHNPHPDAPMTAGGYNGRCQSCHRLPIADSHPAGKDCVSCHMVRRQARDGGHTVFTDHRIARRPELDPPVGGESDLRPWRPPDASLEARNLALAYVNAGVASRSPAQIVRGYRMLTEVQRSMPNDIAVLRGIGRALLLGKQPVEALRAFERVLELTLGNATSEEDVGVALWNPGRWRNRSYTWRLR
jgi:hypothetical protein